MDECMYVCMSAAILAQVHVCSFWLKFKKHCRLCPRLCQDACDWWVGSSVQHGVNYCGAEAQICRCVCINESERCGGTIGLQFGVFLAQDKCVLCVGNGPVGRKAVQDTRSLIKEKDPFVICYNDYRKQSSFPKCQPDMVVITAMTPNGAVKHYTDTDMLICILDKNTSNFPFNFGSIIKLVVGLCDQQ